MNLIAFPLPTNSVQTERRYIWVNPEHVLHVSGRPNGANPRNPSQTEMVMPGLHFIIDTPVDQVVSRLTGGSNA